METLADTYMQLLPPAVQEQITEYRRQMTDSSEAEGSKPVPELVAYRQLMADAEGVPARRTDLEAETATCQYCYGVGKVVNHLLRPGYAGFGEAIPCTACSTSAEQHVARLFRQSIPPRFESVSFDSYPVQPVTAPILAAIQNWVQAPVRGSLFLAGENGVGKSGLAVCAFRARVILNRCDGLFLTSSELLDRIRETYNRDRARGEPGERESDVMAAVKSVSLLVLDDLGAERVTDWVAEKLFALVNHRHSYELATIFTSNLKEGQLQDHVGERTAQRLADMCQLLRFPPEAPNLRNRK